MWSGEGAHAASTVQQPHHTNSNERQVCRLSNHPVRIRRIFAAVMNLGGNFDLFFCCFSFPAATPSSRGRCEQQRIEIHEPISCVNVWRKRGNGRDRPPEEKLAFCPNILLFWHRCGPPAIASTSNLFLGVPCVT